MTFSELQRRLTLPVIAAPMFLVSGVELVIEACKAGIIGAYPSLNSRTAQDFEKTLHIFHEQITLSQDIVAPYAVNLIVNSSNTRLQHDLQLCIQYKVPIIITSLGANEEVVNAVHQYGGLVFHDVIKKRHAEKAAQAGVDAIIAVSAGAGGHAGTLHPFALMQEIRSVYPGPIILAGAISRGQDILAAQALGASLAYMGTRFIASKESMAPEAYKQMVVGSQAEDIVYTDKISGVYGSFLRPSIPDNILLSNTPGRFSVQDSELKAWKNIWSAGHSVSGIETIDSVSKIVAQLTFEYQQAKGQLLSTDEQ